MLEMALVALVGDLEPDLEVAGEASDGYESIRAIATLRPDVVLIDVEMPGLANIAGAAQRASRCSGLTSVVVVVARDQRGVVTDARPVLGPELR